MRHCLRRGEGLLLAALLFSPLFMIMTSLRALSSTCTGHAPTSSCSPLPRPCPGQAV